MDLKVTVRGSKEIVHSDAAIISRDIFVQILNRLNEQSDYKESKLLIIYKNLL